MGMKTATNNCELQVVCPRKAVGVSFRPIHTKTESKKLKDVALPLRNISTVDNRLPGKRNNDGSTGLWPENKITNPQKNSGEHMVNAESLRLKMFCH